MDFHVKVSMAETKAIETENQEASVFNEVFKPSEPEGTTVLIKAADPFAEVTEENKHQAEEKINILYILRGLVDTYSHEALQEYLQGRDYTVFFEGRRHIKRW